MNEAKADETRTNVRDHYAKVSTGQAGCAPGCCAVMPAEQVTMGGEPQDRSEPLQSWSMPSPQTSVWGSTSPTLARICAKSNCFRPNSSAC